MIRFRLLAAVCGYISVLFTFSPASAALLTPAPDGTVEVVSMMTKDFNYTNMSSNVMDLGDGTYRFMGNDLANNGTIDVWDYNWMITANADPFIESVFTITNLTGSTQIFNVSFGLPISPGFSPAFKSGLLDIDFEDTDGSAGASVNLINWDGQIDGSSAMSLFAASIPCTGSGCTGSIGPVSDGPLLHVAGVSTVIGIDLGFDLSTGDSITVTTRFEVTPVPIPAAIWLFGSGMLGLIAITRRKKVS